MPPLNQLQRQSAEIFNPQMQNIQQQLGQLSGVFDPQREAVRQAQRNFFRDIDAQATGRGMFFSGAPIEGRARHITDIVNPQLQQISEREAQQRMGLTQALADLAIRSGEFTMGRLDQLTGQQQQADIAREQMANQRRIAEQQMRATLGSI